VSRSLSGLQALLLGVVVLVGGGLIAAAVFAVGSRQWFGSRTLTVQATFSNIQGVEVGTRVRVRGLDVGEVVGIDLGGDGVVLTMRIRQEFRGQVRKDSQAQIVSVGMLGAKAVEIHPGSVNAPAADEGDQLASLPSKELTDAVEKFTTTIDNVAKGEGTLGKLARDPQAYNSLLALLDQSRSTMATFQQDAEALKRLPVVGGYVEDPQALLVRPRHKTHRKWFRESELFETGQAVLTSGGRARLDDLHDWLDLRKEKKAEVVVVSYADAHSAEAARARHVTEQQSRAVIDYLRSEHKLHKRGWAPGWLPLVQNVKVTALGMGTRPPPNEDSKDLPTPRIEVLVFVPQN
jgi:hypothetical protein